VQLSPKPYRVVGQACIVKYSTSRWRYAARNVREAGSEGEGRGELKHVASILDQVPSDRTAGSKMT